MVTKAKVTFIFFTAIILISGCVGTTEKKGISELMPTNSEADSIGFSFVKESGLTTIKDISSTDRTAVEKVAGYPMPVSAISRRFDIKGNDGYVDATITTYETEDKAKEYYTHQYEKSSSSAKISNWMSDEILSEPTFGKESYIDKTKVYSNNITRFIIVFRSDNIVVEILKSSKTSTDIANLAKFAKIVETKIGVIGN